MAMTEILQVQELKKSYRRGEKITQAVKGLSFCAGAGEVVGVLGPNGSGKTTTLKSIAGLINFEEGKIVVNGFDNIRQRDQMLFHIGAVLEGARNVYWRLSPWENILYFAGLKGLARAQAQQQARQLLDVLDLNEKTHEEVRNLSKGMQQKVALACAIVHQPALILLDEPTLGLDVEIIRTMKPWIREMAHTRQSAILITSHDLDFIEDVCDRVIIIDKGEKVAEASVDELRARHNPQKTVIVTLNVEMAATDINAFKQLGAWDISIGAGKTTLTSTCKELDLLYPCFALLSQKGYSMGDLVVKEDSLEELFLKMIKGKL